MPLSRTRIGFSASLALHTLLILAMLALWKAPTINPPSSTHESITVRLLPVGHLEISQNNVAITAPAQRKALTPKKPSEVVLQSTPVTTEPSPDLPIPNPPSTPTLPTASNIQWGISKESIQKAIGEKSLAEQAQKQIGTPQLSKQDALAQNIERAAKPNCLADRGMGLFNAPFAILDIAKDKCKFD